MRDAVWCRKVKNHISFLLLNPIIYNKAPIPGRKTKQYKVPSLPIVRFVLHRQLLSHYDAYICLSVQATPLPTPETPDPRTEQPIDQGEVKPGLRLLHFILIFKQ